MGQYEELEIDGCKIDFYDVKNKIIHEIKKSDKMEIAHQWQVKYYIYVLECNGIEGATGVLEYPVLRHKSQIILTDNDRTEIRKIKTEIEIITSSDNCPPMLDNKICRNCSYHEFCYITEK